VPGSMTPRLQLAADTEAIKDIVKADIKLARMPSGSDASAFGQWPHASSDRNITYDQIKQLISIRRRWTSGLGATAETLTPNRQPTLSTFQ